MGVIKSFPKSDNIKNDIEKINNMTMSHLFKKKTNSRIFFSVHNSESFFSKINSSLTISVNIVNVY